VAKQCQRLAAVFRGVGLRRLSGCLAAVSAFAVIQAGNVCAGYLSKYGPAPLRFQPAPPASAPIFPPLVKETPLVAPQISVETNQDAPPPTALHPATASDVPDPFLFPQMANSAYPPLMSMVPTVHERDNSAPTLPWMPMTADNLLIIGPETWSEFFKPGQSTNGTNVAVFLPVEFMPPWQNHASDSSIATYSVK